MSKVDEAREALEDKISYSTDEEPITSFVEGLVNDIEEGEHG